MCGFWNPVGLTTFGGVLSGKVGRREGAEPRLICEM